MEKYPTEQEIEYIKHHTLIPIILQVLALDKAAIENHTKISNLYIKVIDRAIKNAEEEALRIRKHFRKYGIKIYAEERDHKGIRVRYKCREYQTEAFYLRPFIKAEAEVLIGEYLRTTN